MKKVNIILASYNGERFIEKQLNSILEQTYSNIDIYIRDDGSSDETMDVVKSVMEKNNTTKRIFILDNGGVNLRCPGSFYEILRRCEPADYYSLCDQDDVWYPEKVAWAVERLEQESSREVLLYYTASDYRNESGELLRTSPEQKEELQLRDVLYYTPGSGFTIVINEKARQELLLKVEPGQELHDRWLIRSAVCFGKVIYDKRSSATHIRHEQAVTAGDAGNSNLIKNFLKNELFGPDAVQEKEYLRYFQSVYEEKLTEKQRKLLHIFTRKNTPVSWVQKVFYPKRLRRRILGEIPLRMLFFFGRI